MKLLCSKPCVVVTTLLLLVVMVLVLPDGIMAAKHSLRTDPDTTCSEAYQKNTTKEACLVTKDHFGRSCSFCQDHTALLCYNHDEARWAKFFGAKCEVRPGESEEASTELLQEE